MFFRQFPENVVLLVGRALLVDRGIIVVRSDMCPVIIRLFVEAVGTCPESEVAAPMSHIHGERVVVGHQKVELIGILWY